MGGAFIGVADGAQPPFARPIAKSWRAMRGGGCGGRKELMAAIRAGTGGAVGKGGRVHYFWDRTAKGDAMTPKCQDSRVAARMARAPGRALRGRAMLAALLLAAMPVAAQADRIWPVQTAAPEAAADTAALLEALRMDDILAILQAEGTESARQIEEDMFPGQGGAGWAAKVQAIYDLPRMRAAFETAFADAIGGNPDAVAASVDFFTSDLGQRILTLEIEGRRALLDDAVEDAAKLGWSRIEAEGTARAEQLRRFAEVNDLIEANVQGALNSNLAFFRGMVDAGGALAEMGEEEMLASVWSQEEEVRQNTVDWLYPYLALAYEPLPDADLDAYIAYSETPAGQAVNAALFAAYGAVFEGISQALGGAAGLQMQGQDI